MEPIQVSLADDGRAVTVAAGQQVVVRLPENATTGYRWDRAGGSVEVVADEYPFAGRHREWARLGSGCSRLARPPKQVRCASN